MPDCEDIVDTVAKGNDVPIYLAFNKDRHFFNCNRRRGCRSLGFIYFIIVGMRKRRDRINTRLDVLLQRKSIGNNHIIMLIIKDLAFSQGYAFDPERREIDFIHTFQINRYP